MARPKNHPTEALLKYVNDYIKSKPTIVLLQAVDIARYCTDVLHIVPEVSRYTLTRNTEVKSFIEDYNRNMLERRIMSGKGNTGEIDSWMADINAPDLEDELIKANRHIEQLGAANHKLYLSLQASNASVDSLEKRVAELEKELENVREKNRLIPEYSKIIRKLRAVIQTKLYDRAVLSQFIEKKHLISNDEFVKDNIRFVREEASDDDFVTAIQKYEALVGESDPSDEDPAPASDIVPEEPVPKVYSKAECDFLSKLDEF